MMTSIKKAQTKLNVRALMHGSVNVAIALLNKDFRESLVDYTIASAKENISANKNDLKRIAMYPRLTLLRRAVNNIFDTAEINSVYAVDHLNSDLLKAHLQKSIDLALEASGWTIEEFNNLRNIDSSAMTISTKIAHALATPKEESIISEGKAILMEFAAPFIETTQRFSAGMEEVNELALEEFNKLPQDEEYILRNGNLVHKNDLEAYEKFSTNYYLTNELKLNQENADALKVNDGTHYELVDGVVELLTKYREGELHYSDYNQKVADLIQREVKGKEFLAKLEELQARADKGEITQEKLANFINKLQKEYGL